MGFQISISFDKSCEDWFLSHNSPIGSLKLIYSQFLLSTPNDDPSKHKLIIYSYSLQMKLNLTDRYEDVEKWSLSNDGNPLLLDLRNIESDKSYYQFVQHSTSIPTSTVRDRWYELPNKWTPFSTLIDDTEDHREYLLELINKGWCLQYQFKTTIQFWEHCKQLNLLKNNFSEISKNILFSPNFYLKSKLNIIQSYLLNDDNSQETNWKVMDLGCGCGRDLAFLSLQNKRWECYGVDSWKGSIDRCYQLFSNISLTSQLKDLLYFKFTKEGALKNLTNDTIYHQYKDYDSNTQFDLILIIRFLIRNHFQFIDKMIQPGGFLLISTFVNLPDMTYESPKGNDNRLELNELKEYFVDGLNYGLIDNSIGYIEDGRPVNCFLARKKSLK